MKIIITENQNYIIRRYQQFIGIVEEQIERSELIDNNVWWCMAYYNPEIFLERIVDSSIEEFISQNWDFFHDDSETGGANMDISMLNKLVEQNYGNYIRNLWVRKCK